MLDSCSLSTRLAKTRIKGYKRQPGYIAFTRTWHEKWNQETFSAKTSIDVQKDDERIPFSMFSYIINHIESWDMAVLKCRRDPKKQCPSDTSLPRHCWQAFPLGLRCGVCSMVKAMWKCHGHLIYEAIVVQDLVVATLPLRIFGNRRWRSERVVYGCI